MQLFITSIYLLYLTQDLGAFIFEHGGEKVLHEEKNKGQLSESNRLKLTAILADFAFKMDPKATKLVKENILRAAVDLFPSLDNTHGDKTADVVSIMTAICC